MRNLGVYHRRVDSIDLIYKAYQLTAYLIWHEYGIQKAPSRCTNVINRKNQYQFGTSSFKKYYLIHRFASVCDFHCDLSDGYEHQP